MHITEFYGLWKGKYCTEKKKYTNESGKVKLKTMPES